MNVHFRNGSTVGMIKRNEIKIKVLLLLSLYVNLIVVFKSKDLPVTEDSTLATEVVHGLEINLKFFTIHQEIGNGKHTFSFLPH